MSKRISKGIKLQTAFNIKYSVWKTTFKTIYQLSCFVGHPVDEKKIVMVGSNNIRLKRIYVLSWEILCWMLL